MKKCYPVTRFCDWIGRYGGGWLVGENSVGIDILYEGWWVAGKELHLLGIYEDFSLDGINPNLEKFFAFEIAQPVDLA